MEPAFSNVCIMQELDFIPGPADSALDPEHYHLIISPALQVAAELAAVRGDPDLYNDLASMLAMRAIVQKFGHWFIEQSGNLPESARQAIEHAPEAVSTMVLKRGDLDATQMRECLWALNTAQAQLQRDKVLAMDEEQGRKIWRLLCKGQREEAIANLKFAAGQLVQSIDNWERQRDAAATQNAS